MDIYKLQRDILEASKLLEAIGESSNIFCKLELDTLADSEVIKRAEAIHWSLLMYCNDVSAMLGQWRAELRSSLIFEEENSNSQPTSQGREPAEINSLCISCVKENCSQRSELSCCPVTICAMRQAK